jgi:hypothetical protein
VPSRSTTFHRRQQGLCNGDRRKSPALSDRDCGVASTSSPIVQRLGRGPRVSGQRFILEFAEAAPPEPDGSVIVDFPLSSDLPRGGRDWRGPADGASPSRSGRTGEAGPPRAILGRSRHPDLLCEASWSLVRYCCSPAAVIFDADEAHAVPGCPSPCLGADRDAFTGCQAWLTGRPITGRPARQAVFSANASSPLRVERRTCRRAQATPSVATMLCAGLLWKHACRGARALPGCTGARSIHVSQGTIPAWMRQSRPATCMPWGVMSLHSTHTVAIAGDRAARLPTRRRPQGRREVVTRAGHAGQHPDALRDRRARPATTSR